jgi:hypothetical protein
MSPMSVDKLFYIYLVCSFLDVYPINSRPSGPQLLVPFFHSFIETHAIAGALVYYNFNFNHQSQNDTMVTPDHHSSNASLSVFDEKEDHHAPGNHEKDVEAALPPHSLMPEISKRSTHPLEQVESRQHYSGWKWVLTCFALYSSAFLYGLDNTIVADIQSAAIETFGAVDKLAWLGSGFPLGSIAVILPVGKAFGKFDVKWMFIGSLLMFVGGSALCGGAPNMNALIIGRVWAGAGGAVSLSQLF